MIFPAGRAITLNAISVDEEISDKLKKAKLENGFYNLIDGERVSAGKTLSVVNPATGNQLAIVPDIDRVLLNKAVNAARKAFSGWRAVPFSQRRAILTSLLDKISEHDRASNRGARRHSSSSAVGNRSDNESLRTGCLANGTT